MTLSEFIRSKPPELRLGQYFCNTYLHRLRYNDKMQSDKQYLYNTTSHLIAIQLISQIMKDYQWEELP